MSCDCFRIGGPFIGADPDCAEHRPGGLLDQAEELQTQEQRITDLEAEVALLKSRLDALEQA